MSVPLAIAEAAHAAAGPARAVSDTAAVTAAVTAGVEAALAAGRRYWARRLLTHLRELPSTARSQRDLVTALAEEFYAAAADIDHGASQEPNHV